MKMRMIEELKGRSAARRVKIAIMESPDGGKTAAEVENERYNKFRSPVN